MVEYRHPFEVVAVAVAADQQRVGMESQKWAQERSGSPSWTRFELSWPARHRRSGAFSSRFRHLRVREHSGGFFRSRTATLGAPFARLAHLAV